MTVLREMKSNQRNKFSLATLLTGLVSLTVLLTLSILIIASYQSNKQALYDTTLTLNYSSATKMSQTMDSLFKSMRSSLKYTAATLSNSSHLSSEDMLQHLELARNNSNYFNSLVAVDENGIVRSVSPQSAGSIERTVTTEAAKEALALRKSYLSKAYYSANGRLIVFMSEPVFDRSGTYRGFLGGTIYLQQDNILNMIFGSNNTEETGSYMYVVGSDGYLLFHPDKSRLGEDVNANTVVQKLVQGKSGYGPVINLKGVHLLAGYSSVPENGWGIAVVSPLSAVQEQLNLQIRTILLYTLPAFILLLLAVIWFARRLASPFVSLANLVSRMGRGRVNPPEVKHHWNREADLLAKTISLALTYINKQTDQLTRDAMTDPLTGLHNRRTLEKLMNNWTVNQIPYSLVMIDIDKFKTINDTYGHLVGDEVLKHLAQIISLTIRSSDECCRYGGEEFVVLLARHSVEEAYIVAERIRIAVENSDAGIGKPVTISLGIAHYPSQTDSIETLFTLADQALYKAKGSGRNRTIIAE
jgi:diguanylate cyclase (GGDEF)-like protein